MACSMPARLTPTLCVCSRPRTGFDRGNLEWLERLFKETVGDQKEIRRDDFNKIVISKNVSVRPWPCRPCS